MTVTIARSWTITRPRCLRRRGDPAGEGTDGKEARDEPEFAKFVGNVAVNEIGHLIGLWDLDGFMTEWVRRLRPERRSKADMRRILSAR